MHNLQFIEIFKYNGRAICHMLKPITIFFLYVKGNAAQYDDYGDGLACYACIDNGASGQWTYPNYNEEYAACGNSENFDEMCPECDATDIYNCECDFVSRCEYADDENDDKHCVKMTGQRDGNTVNIYSCANQILPDEDGNYDYYDYDQQPWTQFCEQNGNGCKDRGTQTLNGIEFTGVQVCCCDGSL